MTRELEDGTIVSDGMRIHDKSGNRSDAMMYIPYPVRAQVMAIFYLDDKENRDGETTVCDLHVTSMGIDLFKVPFSLPKAGVDNYISFSPVAATGAVNLVGPFNTVAPKPKLSNGDTVIVVFIDGDVNQPMIIGMHPHNQSGRDAKYCPSPREGKSKGDHFKIRFNGTNFIIDKDGNVKIENTATLVDPRNIVTPQKKFTVEMSINPPAGAPALLQKLLIELDNSGTGVATLKATNMLGLSQTVEMDAASNTTKIECEHTAGLNSIELSPSGITLDVINGDVNMNVTGGSVNQNVTGGDIVIESATGGVTIKGLTDIAVESLTGDVSIKATAANVNIDSTQKVVINALTDCEINATLNAKITAAVSCEVTAAMIKLNAAAMGMVVTNITSPLIDNITGAPQLGVPTVIAG